MPVSVTVLSAGRGTQALSRVRVAPPWCSRSATSNQATELYTSAYGQRATLAVMA